MTADSSTSAQRSRTPSHHTWPWLPAILLAAAVFGPLLSSGPAHAGTTEAYTLPAQPHPGSRERRYKVYLPDGLNGPAPLVMALHGCQQTHDDVLRDWGLTAAADRHRFILVAPFITSYDGARNPNCWGFWFDQHRREGRGEPEDLHQIARAVEARHPVDPRRRYVLGLSSGGAMAVVLSVTHNEYFAAVASASGLPYGEDAAAVSLGGCSVRPPSVHPVDRIVADMQRERDAAYRIPLLVLQNAQDCTVRPVNGTNLRDAQLALNGGAAHDTASKARAREQACAPVFQRDHGCRHTFYTVDAQPGSRSLVETVFYSGPRATPDPSDTDHAHYWIGGSEGRDGRWAVRDGPSYPEIIWDFFARHPADATAGPAPPPSPPTGPPPEPPPSCTAITSAPGTHVATGRAMAGGWLLMRALSSGERRDIGFAWDLFWTAVTLHQGEGGLWYVEQPAACR